MKLLTLSALSMAILAASSVQAESFVDDSTLDIHLRNYYKSDKVTNNKKQSSWAQGARAEFSSGYFMGLIGLDLNWYGSLKLSGDKNESNNGLLRNSGPTNALKSKSYSKAGAAIKFNLMDMATVKYGRMFIDTPLLNDSDSRVTPSLTEALMAEGEFAGVNLYGIHARENSARTESGFEAYGSVDSTGKMKKHSVNIVGGGYDFDNGLSVTAAYGSQKEWANQLYLDAAYEMPLGEDMSASFGTQYAKKKMKGNGRNYEIDDDGNFQNNRLDDASIHFWGLSAGLSVGNLNVGLTYTDVDQPTSNTKDGLDSASMQWGGQEGMQDSGFMGYNALAIKDFDRAGQSAWGINVGYDLSDLVQGLSTSAVYVDSKIDTGTSADPKDNKEKEYNLKANYAVPAVEGLSVDLVYAKNTRDNRNTNTKTTHKDKRIIIKYDIAVF